MRKKFIIILIAVFAAGLLSGIFIPDLLKRRNLSPSPSKFLSNYLSLSEAQERKIESLNKSFHAKVQEIRAKLNQKTAELSELLGEPSPNREKIEAKINEITSLQAQLQRETINHLERIRAVLTPEQQAKFFSLIRKRLRPEGPWRRRF